MLIICAGLCHKRAKERRAPASMSRKGPSVIGTGGAPDRRLFVSGPGGHATLPPRRVAPPCGPFLPSRPDPPCGGP